MGARQIEVRAATSADEAALVRVDAEAFRRGPRRKHFAAACSGRGDPRQTLLVLSEQQVVRAFIDYALVLEEATIHDIAVDPGHRGTGLGGYLLRRALEQMKSEGAVRCLLEVRASNSAALALYLGSGFSVDGERRNYYPAANGRENALLMSRQL